MTPTLRPALTLPVLTSQHTRLRPADPRRDATCSLQRDKMQDKDARCKMGIPSTPKTCRSPPPWDNPVEGTGERQPRQMSPPSAPRRHIMQVRRSSCCRTDGRRAERGGGDFRVFLSRWLPFCCCRFETGHIMEGQVRWAESYETRRWGELLVSSMGCGGVIRGDVWVPGFPWILFPRNGILVVVVVVVVSMVTPEMTRSTELDRLRRQLGGGVMAGRGAAPGDH